VAHVQDRQAAPCERQQVREMFCVVRH
jgi:hypothetical protein